MILFIAKDIIMKSDHILIKPNVISANSIERIFQIQYRLSRMDINDNLFNSPVYKIGFFVQFYYS